MNPTRGETDPPPGEGRYTLLGPDRKPYRSNDRGELGGHRRGRIYGRLDCRAARQAIERGGYVKDRVFFADEEAAIAAGFRPCAVCMPDEYRTWKEWCSGERPGRRWSADRGSHERGRPDGTPPKPEVENSDQAGVFYLGQASDRSAAVSFRVTRGPPAAPR